jgi:hypothetical protein
MRHFLRAALFAIILSLSLSPVVQAQTSVGYQDPADNSNLLDYRLPNWSYRTWNADFGFNGGGSDSRRGGDVIASNANAFNLGSDYFQAWESEQRYFDIAIDLGGNYRRSHRSTPATELKSRDLDGSYALGGEIIRYLGDGPFSLRLDAATRRTYSERINAVRLGDIWEDNEDYVREAKHRIFGGLGWGRLRNVEPILRAQRLSERLVALGRQPLASAQMQEVAAVWAQNSGYFRVYDRFGRHFWDDVLTPMLDPANPLTAYEMLYLMDVFEEQLGDRYQGLEVLVEYGYTGSTGDGGIFAADFRSRTPRIGVAFFHNLSLTQQVHASGRYAYAWTNADDRARDNGYVDVTLEHLWNLTDRYRLDTSFKYRGMSEIQGELRGHRGSLGSVFNVFLEDQLSLQASVQTSYQWSEQVEDVDQNWRWTYGVGLVYHLDRAIF